MDQELITLCAGLAAILMTALVAATALWNEKIAGMEAYERHLTWIVFIPAWLGSVLLFFYLLLK